MANKSTVEQDQAILTKLLYDFGYLRERVSNMYEIDQNAPEFVLAEAQLLRLEAKVCSLQGMIWYKKNVNLLGNSFRLAEFLHLSRRRNRPLNLLFIRGMLRYSLCADGESLTLDQRRQLSTRLHKVLRLISHQRFLLENRLHNITNALVTFCKSPKREPLLFARQLLEADQSIKLLSVLNDNFK